MTNQTEPAKRPKPAPKPKSASEIIDRLAAPTRPGKKVTLPAIRRLFRTKTRMPTSESERTALCEHLRRVDQTWEVRAGIVTHGYPELAQGSTATLGHALTVEAREVTAYPTTGLADPSAITRWIDGLWRGTTRPGGRVMPWIALVALWPDRHLPTFGSAISNLLSGPIAIRTPSKSSPIEQLACDLTDPPKGERLLGEVNAILQPMAASAARITSLESDLDAALKRNASSRMEVGELEIEVARMREALRETEFRASDAERRLTSGLSEAERRLMETSGRASQAHARTATTFGPEVVSHANDIEMFLDRDVPNVQGAIRKAKALVELGKRLEAEGS